MSISTRRFRFMVNVFSKINQFYPCLINIARSGIIMDVNLNFPTRITSCVPAFKYEFNISGRLIYYLVSKTLSPFAMCLGGFPFSARCRANAFYRALSFEIKTLKRNESN